MSRRIGRLVLLAAVAGIIACSSNLGPAELPQLARGAPNVGQGNGGVDPIPDVIGALGDAAGQVAKMLRCAVQPAATTTMDVGPGGATLWAGNHRLRIPEGALSRVVTITMTVPAEPYAVVKFLPAGLVFNKKNPKPILTMNLAGCATPPVANVGIKYVTESNVILESLNSQWNGKSGTIAAPVEHFSRYAVAW